MGDQTIVLQAIHVYRTANIVIGACYLWIATAFVFYFLKRPSPKGNVAFLAICAFLFAAGLSRFAKGIPVVAESPVLVVSLDGITSLLGIGAALITWPLLSALLKLPSRDEIEELNAKLMHSQAILETFMSRTPVLQFVKDRQLRFLYVNDAYCRAFGVKRETILGKTEADWMSAEMVERMRSSDLRALETMQPVETEEIVTTADGIRHLMVVKFPIWDEQLMLGGVAIDCTEQKIAEGRERRTRETFGLMISAVKEYAIFLLDPNGFILTWNEGAKRLNGYEPEEVIGKHFSIFYPPEALEDRHPQFELEQAKKDGQYEEEGWRVRKDNSRFWASVIITAVFDEDKSLKGFVKVTKDLTDRKQYEHELAAARDKALEASALKSAFVANISHEIRTPLSGILGMNELLLQTNLDDVQREYASTVQASSQSLLTVLNDVLDLSKIEAGKMHLAAIPFNVSFTVQDATRLMSATAMKKGLSLTHQIDAGIPELVIGDPERLRQVLLNLIGNAVKFTNKGEVSVHAHRIDEDIDTVTIKFVIKDTGIGIAEEDRDYLFVPFAQVDPSSTRRFGGTGLGLTISKHIVTLMGGEIGFESKRGKGSTFWFTIAFPKTVFQPTDSTLRRATGTNPTEPTVLVVEDNAILQALAVKQFENLGIKCVVAKSGTEAVQSVSNTEFDAIFMDCHLPNMDGYETTNSIRKVERTRNRRTPIIAMTAHALSGDERKAISAGMDDYIAKPVSLEQLKRICQKWLPSLMPKADETS